MAVSLGHSSLIVHCLDTYDPEQWLMDPVHLTIVSLECGESCLGVTVQDYVRPFLKQLRYKLMIFNSRHGNV